jgi:hypothetical protein
LEQIVVGELLPRDPGGAAGQRALLTPEGAIRRALIVTRGLSAPTAEGGERSRP